MAIHPIETVIVDANNVDKEPFREEMKQYPREFTDAATFNTFDLPNTPNALIGGVLFAFDPADVTTPDNGVSCIHDAAARRFKRAVILLPSTRYIGIAVAGTAQAIEITTSEAISSIEEFSTVLWTPAANITGPDPTAEVDTVPPLPIKSPTGAALAADEIFVGRWYEMMAMGGSTPTEYWLIMGY